MNEKDNLTRIADALERIAANMEHPLYVSPPNPAPWNPPGPITTVPLTETTCSSDDKRQQKAVKLTREKIIAAAKTCPTWAVDGVLLSEGFATLSEEEAQEIIDARQQKLDKLQDEDTQRQQDELYRHDEGEHRD